MKLRLVRNLPTYFESSKTLIGEPDQKTMIILQRYLNSIIRFAYDREKYDHVSDGDTFVNTTLNKFLLRRPLIFVQILELNKTPSYLFSYLNFF